MPLINIFILAIAMQIASCSNDAKFEGKNPAAADAKAVTPVVPGATAIPTPTPLPVASPLSLTWQPDCSGNALTEVASDTGIFIGGFGEKILASAFQILQKINVIKMKGSVCKPSDTARDVVFVIDVSGSMDAVTDPVTNGNCWRSAAISSAIKAIGENSIHRFALVTFSSSIRAQSSKFFSNRDSLFKDLTKTNNSLTDVLCAAYDGTYYEQGLSGAKTLFTTDLRSSQKEIYFISDGMPNAGHDGIDLATELKVTGIKGATDLGKVNIATIMIGFFEDDSKLRSVASVNSSNIPLHARISDASKLVVTLNALSVNEVKFAQLTVTAVNSQKNQIFDIFKILKGDQFEMDTIEFKQEDYPHGIQFTMETHDSKNNAAKKSTIVHWN